MYMYFICMLVHILQLVIYFKNGWNKSFNDWFYIFGFV